MFPRNVALAELKGLDVLLAVEVTDLSLDYDLNRKPRIYAAFSVPELWVIDAKRRVVHVHNGVDPDGYVRITQRGSQERIEPALAPAELGFALDDLPRV